MKQYELKFYREWYDALSELSHEDRAEAALALLEYVYEGKIPEDRFIRIVTTLMRNKIDRDKAAHTGRQSHSCQSPSGSPQAVNTDSRQEASPSHQPDPNSRQAVNTGFRPVSESTDSLPLPPAPENPVTEPSLPRADKCSVIEPLGEIHPPHQQPKTNSQVLLTSEEANQCGINDPEPINQILRTHYNPGNKELSSIARQNNVSARKMAEYAKESLIEMVKANPSKSVLSDFNRTQLDPLLIAKLKRQASE